MTPLFDVILLIINCKIVYNKLPILLTKYIPIQARRCSQKQAEKESPYFFIAEFFDFLLSILNGELSL